MDLRDYIDILRARWRLIMVTTLLGLMAAALASMLATPMYTATATAFVQVNGGDGPTQSSRISEALTASYLAQQRVKSYVEVVTGEDVMNAVIEDKSLDLTANQLAAKIEVNNPLDTVNLEISVTDANPVKAMEIANAVAAQSGSAVAQFEIPNSGDQPLVDMKVLTPATVPTSPSSPRTMINLALGFLVGLAVGVGAAVLLETLDTRIKSIEALAKYFEQPLLGVIGFEADAEKKPLLTDVQGQSKRAESFRQVRTNLQFVDIDHRPKSIVITSAVPREGKTTTAINLALTIAQTGQPVFLIEADLRRPKVADYLNIEGSAGLTDVLVGRATVDEVLQPWGATGNFWVMASGPLPPNPSELLGSQAMSDLVHHLEKRATLIIDAPPLLPVTDAAVLTRLAGGALMVIRTGKTRREQLRTAEQSIETVGGKILGLVMNMAPARGPDSHRYGYGYQYDYSATETRGKYEDHAPVIPAGFGGMPGVNGSPTPTFPVGKVDPVKNGAGGKDIEAPTPARQPAPAPAPEPAPRSAASATVHASDAPTVSVSSSTVAREGKQETKSDAPVLSTVVPAEDKVIGGSAGVPLADAISPYGHRMPQVDLLPADTASGARFGLDDDVPLTDVDEVPVGEEFSPAQVAWTPPAPRAAFDPLTAPRAALDPLTAPYEEVQVADLGGNVLPAADPDQ